MWCSYFIRVSSIVSMNVTSSFNSITQISRQQTVNYFKNEHHCQINNFCFTDNHCKASSIKVEEVNLLHLKIKRIILFCKRCSLNICVSLAKNKMEGQKSR